MTFEQRVKDWLVERGILSDASSVVGVTPLGTDWAGDTMEGFRSDFSVVITYQVPAGAVGTIDVEGSDLESLWKAVVR